MWTCRVFKNGSEIIESRLAGFHQKFISEETSGLPRRPEPVMARVLSRTLLDD